MVKQNLIHSNVKRNDGVEVFCSVKRQKFQIKIKNKLIINFKVLITRDKSHVYKVPFKKNTCFHKGLTRWTQLIDILNGEAN